MVSHFVFLVTALGFANAVSACMLASFTYDPCTSAISGTLIDNGITIGTISPSVNNRDSIGTLIQLSPSFLNGQNIKVYVHTVESISSTTSASTSGKKQGYLSHITLHSPSGDSSPWEVIGAFELVREAKNQQWSNAVYGCDDPIGDAWFYELGGWSRWGGEAHPVSKGEGGKLRCDSEGLMYDGNHVQTGLELAPPAKRRATGFARRQEAASTAIATPTPTPTAVPAFETPVIQVEKPVATAFAKREVGSSDTDSMTKLRAGQVTSGAGGVSERVKPTFKHRSGESKDRENLRFSEVRPEDVGFRKREEKREEGVEKRQIFGSTGTLRGSGLKFGNAGVVNNLEARDEGLGEVKKDEGLGAAWHDLRNGEALKALVQKAAQAAATKVVRREEQEVTPGLNNVGNKNSFEKVERGLRRLLLGRE